MTEGAEVRHAAGMAKGAIGMATNPIQTPAVIPAKAGIQEGRPRGEEMADFTGWRVRLWCLWSFPLCGNGLPNPLDSSAACSRRRSTAYVL